MPSLLPATRWSLKPPFHPYLACKAVCFLWRYPSDCSAQALPGTIPSRSPDFPRCPPPKGRDSAVIRPSTHRLALTPVPVSGQRQAARAEPRRKIVHHRAVRRIKRANVPRAEPLAECFKDRIHPRLAHRIPKLYGSLREFSCVAPNRCIRPNRKPFLGQTLPIKKPARSCLRAGAISEWPITP